MGYSLIISEKPSAALMIANALSEVKVEKLSNHGANYYQIHRKGKDIIVAPAVGHLYILSEKKTSTNWSYPTFSVHWKENYLNKNNEWSRKYFQNIQELTKNADEFISATDYDIEGSVIAYNILRFIAKVNNGKRMKFSTLTKADLVDAYENASPQLNFPQIEAGLARHHLDFFWGINTSRALTLSLKEAGGYKTLSTGRVQGPTLKILEERQKEIEKFKPVPFWQIQLDGLIKKEKITAFHVQDRFWKKDEAVMVLDKTKDKEAFVEKAEKKKYKQPPPTPFDLTTLQREAYAHFGYSPKMTLDIAQNLYGNALISYPRTSSQKLPSKIGFKKIINSLWKQKKYQPFCDELLKKPLKPREGKKIDPAHPSIYPTGNLPKKLSPYDLKIYDLIVKRFLSVFGDPAIRESNNVTIDVNNEKFIAQGVTTLEKNWIEIYAPYAKFKEQILPPMNEGDRVDVEKIILLDKETQPPSRYTQASILKEMEKLGLGTKATRAHILQTLYDRVYIKEPSIEVTKLGESVVTALEKYCSEIISVDLTKEFENDMESILEGKKKREDIVKDAEKTLLKILEKFRKNENRIGEILLVGLREVLKQESTIGKCRCGGDLTIRTSRAQKRFVGCSSYPKCTETFSLPQRGYISVQKETCKKCDLPVLSIKSKGRRPWKLCIRDGYVVVKKPKTEKKGKPGKKEKAAKKDKS